MLKKRLGIEAIEKDWMWMSSLKTYYKIPSSLIIPEGVKEIGDKAFEYCDRLKKVIIPESVVWIGQCAFQCCSNATIVLKKSRNKFCFTAFDGCKNVKEEIRN